MPDYVPYSPPLLGAFVEFWNLTFADRRNFVPLTAEGFERRVVAKRNAVEAFDPRSLILAVEPDAAAGAVPRVLGAAHAGTWPEAFARVLDSAWGGGSMGYIAFLAVDPAHRRRGIGGELWGRAAASLRSCRRIVIDGQCMNPFYGNSEGPETCFWGTPEGISISWMDVSTQRFFRRRGHAPRYRGAHLQWIVEPAKDAARVQPPPKGISILTLQGRYPEIGRPLSHVPTLFSQHPFTCFAAHDAVGRVVGILSLFPLVGLDAGRYAVYEWLVLPELRKTGLGRNLLAAAQDYLRQCGATACDALTLPAISGNALTLYLGAGFREVDAWAIY